MARTKKAAEAEAGLSEELLGAVDELNKVLKPDPLIIREGEAEAVQKDLLNAANDLSPKEKAALSAPTKKVLVGLGLAFEEGEKDTGAAARQKKAEKKAKDTPEGKSKPGIISSIVEAITAGPKTLDQVLAILTKKFPDRDAKGMRSTVYIQLNGRLAKTKGLVIKKDKESGVYTLGKGKAKK